MAINFEKSYTQCRHYRHGLSQELGGGAFVEVE